MRTVVEFRVDGPAVLRRTGRAPVEILVTRLRIAYVWRDDDWRSAWTAIGRRRLGEDRWSDDTSEVILAGEVDEPPQWISDAELVYHPHAEHDPEQDAQFAVARARQVARSWRDAAMKRTPGDDPCGTWAAVAHVCAQVLGALDGDADAADADGEPVLRPEHLLPAWRL
ncbi:hypothetical protein C1J01_08700 [Nonomuraea aridisoli]|uniref:Uncharacterized protein n=1 Tax=Nonomuraea aridisoli TaxID=2070368 RepID=A0A2W2E8Y4_9ACTN|nr:hypothetical protein C1J01_08700 [Nonomuraea aridisoli]